MSRINPLHCFRRFRGRDVESPDKPKASLHALRRVEPSESHPPSPRLRRVPTSHSSTGLHPWLSAEESKVIGSKGLTNRHLGEYGEPSLGHLFQQFSESFLTLAHMQALLHRPDARGDRMDNRHLQVLL